VKLNSVDVSAMLSTLMQSEVTDGDAESDVPDLAHFMKDNTAESTEDQGASVTGFEQWLSHFKRPFDMKPDGRGGFIKMSINHTQVCPTTEWFKNKSEEILRLWREQSAAPGNLTMSLLWRLYGGALVSSTYIERCLSTAGNFEAGRRKKMSNKTLGAWVKVSANADLTRVAAGFQPRGPSDVGHKRQRWTLKQSAIVSLKKEKADVKKRRVDNSPAGAASGP